MAESEEVGKKAAFDISPVIGKLPSKRIDFVHLEMEAIFGIRGRSLRLSFYCVHI